MGKQVKERRSLSASLSQQVLVFPPPRYLDHYFAIHPEIKEDGSNLANALMTMWASYVDSKGGMIYTFFDHMRIASAE